jgi:hypothetical protein
MEQFGTYREDRNPAPSVFREALRGAYEVRKEPLSPMLEELLRRLDASLDADKTV